MALSGELAADYAAAIPDYDQTFTWNGKPYACTRTTAPAGIALVPGAEEISASDRITVAAGVFTDGKCPRFGDLIDRNRLQIVKIDPNAGSITYWCAPPMNVPAGRMSME